MQGIFITIEGPDGSGKSTLIKELIPLIEKTCRVPLCVTREPGGIDISEQIRQIILSPENSAMDDRTEALLYAAARRQHLVQKVLPALEAGKLVLCDRFVDSSLAYQGAGRQLGMEEVWQINQFAIQGTMPNLTLYLDVDAAVGLERINKGRKTSELDRLDQEALAFHETVREAYLVLLDNHPERIKKIDASQDIATVTSACYNLVREHFPDYFN
ncbi:dTMP kinase [Vagococcus penaei]|uniref:Thymidylate kinase n=1 Tax=Vagococcus penaei TaxID=633807 RepID=A0A1Q2D7I9_9ENTE|nr:dTMP kinase [Vagococcus penaei]AQP54329.1 dTMP kinase [Vagococcus penaei]RSU05785.1 dTMP kinase [Vagococcus penaei]